MSFGLPIWRLVDKSLAGPAYCFSLHKLHVTYVLSDDREVVIMASVSVVLHATALTMLSPSFAVHHEHNGEESPLKRMKALTSYEYRISLQLHCYGYLG